MPASRPAAASAPHPRARSDQDRVYAQSTFLGSRLIRIPRSTWPPPQQANQLGDASCLLDETFCHNPRFFKADDKQSASICHVTMIPFAAVIGVLVAELKIASAGLGFRLANYYEQFNIAGMYALIVIIFALAAFANIGMTRLQDRANRHMAPTMSKGRKARATASGGLGVVATN